MNLGKKKVYDFWNASSCGESLYLLDSEKESFMRASQIRYTLEPYILKFLPLKEIRGKKVLEVGVGLGADHEVLAQNGADLWGIDLTERAVEYTERRFKHANLTPKLMVADAEALPFPDDFFDIIYSWGVLHHSPDTPKAVKEIERVLKKDGKAYVMIYHKWSLVGFMLWFRYAFLTFKLNKKMSDIYSEYLESPGTKAYSIAEARRLFSCFSQVTINLVLSHGDLLTSQAGQRHGGLLLTVARILMPRKIIQWMCPFLGLFMLIEAKK